MFYAVVPSLYRCPHCGALFVLSIYSFELPFLRTPVDNEVPLMHWSDGHQIIPTSNPYRCNLRKCPDCHTWSFYREWKVKETGDALSRLMLAARRERSVWVYQNMHVNTYDDAKEAYLQFRSDERFDKFPKHIKIECCRNFVQAYNTRFFRHSAVFFEAPEGTGEKIPDKDVKLFGDASEFLMNFSDKEPKDIWLEAELLRERKEFNKAFALFKSLRPHYGQWVDPMMDLCRKSKNELIELKSSLITGIEEAEVPLSDIMESKRSLAQQIDRVDDIISSFDERRKKDIVYDGCGGFYENQMEILLRLSDDCARSYTLGYSTEDVANAAAFQNFRIESLAFSLSLRSIGAKAFQDCRNLRNLSFHDHRSSLDRPQNMDNARKYIEMVSSAISIKIESIGMEAFRDCSKIVRFPEGFLAHVRFIGRAAFAGMSMLQKIELPAGLEAIPDSCFESCESLSRIEIPETVAYIGENAFSQTGITSILLPDSVTEVRESAFRACRQLQEVRLSGKTEVIEPHAFQDCENLRHIEIPASVVCIEKDAFKGCALKTVCFKGKPDFFVEAFISCTIEHVIVPRCWLKGYRIDFPNSKVTAGSWKGFLRGYWRESKEKKQKKELIKILKTYGR